MDVNGYLTGWYVFSALGLYLLEPSRGFYVIGIPVFTNATLHVRGPDEGYGVFVIEAHNASEENIYIQSTILNGKKLNMTYFHHADMIPGGSLVFEMGPAPNDRWGEEPESGPPSVTAIKTEKSQNAK